jgi:uncharacterized membrane protein
MPDVTDIPSKALEVARKATPTAKSPKGMATAGAALIALPYAAQGIAKLKGAGAEKAAEVGKSAKRKATEKALPKGLTGLFGGDGADDGGESGDEEITAHGSGRRMPIQQAVDVAVPIKVAYNLWTQFEDWPTFMHRVDSAEQVDDSTVALTTKVWGVTKRFEAEILEQRPDQRIEWDVNEGLSHSGVVTFHELARRLTRIEVSLDVEPNSLLEKAGRGMRFSKRAVRGDLHRFKAYAEIEEAAESGGWRGTIEDGDVKRKTERKASRSSGRSRSSSRQNKNGADPSGSSRRSGSHN